MAAKFHAIFDGKALCPEGPVDLRANERYVVTVQPVDEALTSDSVEDDPAFDLSSLAIETGLPNLAAEHDHYLYGRPKGNGPTRHGA